MCMRMTQVRPHQCWNWGGDEIVHNPIIKAQRIIPGTDQGHYEIDIRQFISSTGNAVLGKAIKEIVKGLTDEEMYLFQSKTQGAFDFRKDKVLEYLSHFRYRPIDNRFHPTQKERIFEPWLFPSETYALKQGDCEDLAFLVATLLEASGISSYCIRVALGVIIDHSAPKGGRRWDHAWVMYKDEGGAWEIIEPLAHCMDAVVKKTRQKKEETPRDFLETASKQSDIEYVPYYVFNRQHLWRVRSPFPIAGEDVQEYLKKREFWDQFNPSFAITVHNDILDEALKGMKVSWLNKVKRAGFWADVNVLNYDPRDHSDFAYIDESWELANERLSSGKLTDFGLAVHAIADFYAHSMYAEFAPIREDGMIALYSKDFDPSVIKYDFSSFHVPGCKKRIEEAAKLWQGKIISGQWWRWYSTFPDELENAPGFWRHRCLPDHDKLAVDGLKPKHGDDHLYNKQEYKRQFCLRQAAAKEHIRSVYKQWKPLKKS